MPLDKGWTARHTQEAARKQRDAEAKARAEQAARNVYEPSGLRPELAYPYLPQGQSGSERYDYPYQVAAQVEPIDHDAIRRAEAWKQHLAFVDNLHRDHEKLARKLDTARKLIPEIERARDMLTRMGSPTAGFLRLLLEILA